MIWILYNLCTWCKAFSIRMVFSKGIDISQRPQMAALLKRSPTLIGHQCPWSWCRINNSAVLQWMWPLIQQWLCTYHWDVWNGKETWILIKMIFTLSRLHHSIKQLVTVFSNITEYFQIGGFINSKTFYKYVHILSMRID